MNKGFKIIETEIDKPLTDNRLYRVIKLENELEALLIHDPDTDKASASLDVNVGSFSDPRSLPGLAHFCEHLLFMGTKKYPKENEYSVYLSEHSGMSNAYTSLEETNYFFEVSYEYLEGAFDRFAQFFLEPLFSPNAQDREILAVDSENKKNLQNDLWRMYQLERSLSNPNHPYNSFSTGNYETLSVLPKSEGIDTREELLKFYSNNYSSNIMKLVILGRESLDTLQDWVVNRLSGVKNTNKTLQDYGVPLLSSNELVKIVKAKPIMDTKYVELLFPIPDLRWDYETHPGIYFSHLIGHEGPGSILHYLNAKGWASACTSTHLFISRGSGLFSISFDLTDLGMKNYKEVVIHIFEYLHIFSDEASHEWIFREIADVADANFKFAQKESPSTLTSRLSSLMQHPNLPRKFILSPNLFRKYDPKLIKEIAKYLNPNNFKIFLVGQTNETLPKKEKWYGTEFSNLDIDDEWLQRIRNVKLNPQLHLPEPNKFIPTNFSLVSHKALLPLRHPFLLKNNNLIRSWHKKDDTFLVPKASLRLKLRNPICNSNPYNSARAILIVDLLNDQLLEFAYSATISGLKYNVVNSKDVIEINLDGYNDKIEMLLEKILLKLKNLSFTESQFALVKETTFKRYKNFGYDTPYSQISHYSQHLLNENAWTIKEQRDQINDLNHEEVLSFVPEFLRNLHIEVLISGNLLRGNADSISQLIISTLDPKPLSHSQFVNLRSYLLPPSSAYHYDIVMEDPKNVNSCIDYMIQIGKISDNRLRALLELLSQISKEPAFNQLRTKEQLGYVVFSGIKTTRTMLFHHVLVQSEKSCEYLETRIDNYLSSVLGPLVRNMSKSDFNKHVDSIVAKKLEKNKNLNEEVSSYWNQITSGFYNFEQNFVDAEEIKKLTKDDLVDFLNIFIDPNSDKRSTLVLRLNSQLKSNETVISKRPHSIPITDYAVFKNSLMLTEAPIPIKDLVNFIVTEEKL